MAETRSFSSSLGLGTRLEIDIIIFVTCVNVKVDKHVSRPWAVPVA